MKTLLLVSLILSMMVYIGLKFFSAPSPSWGMAFKSRSQTFHTRSSAFAFPFPSHCVKVFQMLISQQSLLTEASDLELRYLGGSSEIPRE